MEGPSIHILSEELQVFIGQTIIEAYGNAAFDKEPLRHQVVQEIYPFGKRLMIQLEHYVIIIHFLMYGSYRIQEERIGFSPRLALITHNNSLYFYNCSIKCVQDPAYKNNLELELDILSPFWDLEKTVAAMRMNSTSTIDDVLLDQDIFTGVGNIIKNETLFLSHVKPSTAIENLSDAKLREIALTARLFSQKFLELRKIFALKKNLLMYRKKQCPSCGSLVIRQKTGIKNRWSFYCPSCQR